MQPLFNSVVIVQTLHRQSLHPVLSCLFLVLIPVLAADPDISIKSVLSREHVIVKSSKNRFNDTLATLPGMTTQADG
jgi:hypothetical protein